MMFLGTISLSLLLHPFSLSISPPLYIAPCLSPSPCLQIVYLLICPPMHTYMYMYNLCRLRRDGRHVSRTLLRKLLYTADCNTNLTSMVTQQDFLKALQLKLKKKATSGDVIAAMATIRERLTAVSNLHVVMATDVHSLPHPTPLEPWTKFLSNTERYAIVHGIDDHFHTM